VFRGRDFDGHVFRVTRGCPPTLADFSSYEALGIRYDRRDFFKGSGISTDTTAARPIAVVINASLSGALWRRSIPTAKASSGRRPVEATSPSGRRRPPCSNRWFNVRAMTAEGRYLLLDQASMNQLGEFDTFVEAEKTLLRFVAADARAADSLEIWDDELDVRMTVDPDKLRQATAA